MLNAQNYVLLPKAMLNLWRKYGINPFDTLLKKAKKANARRILVCWNRGLGDIPLGLYALTHRIRHFIPEAEVTFATRSDLADGFKMLEGASVIVDPEWKRGVPFDLKRTLQKLGRSLADFDLVLEHPDPTRWLMWQLGALMPRLAWNRQWDPLHERFALGSTKPKIGVHVQTETNYAYEKNWPIDAWKEFFRRAVQEKGVEIVLFGFAPTPAFEEEGLIDLRGKTALFEMLSIIKHRCRYLLVPDSGVLSITYYLDAPFPIDIVSLWSDPRQGVLKQDVASPNPLLRHTPLLAKGEDLRNIGVESVMQTLFSGGAC
jgi:ADP-heptose:LPS heptosyltransferase